jgi:hypothetical protein
MSGMEAEVVAGFKERGEHIQYQTGKIVLNWAQTFQCQPERFYYPKSEDDVVEVFPIIEISCDLSG